MARMAAGLDVAGAPAVHSEPASQPPTLRARSVVWPTDLPDPFGHGLGPNAERIRERIAAVRREGHRRRLRVQLPALCVGCVCAVGAVVIVVTQARWWLYGFTSLHMAPFFVLLSLMPTDITALRAYLAFAGAVILFALWWLCVNVLQPSRARLLAAEMRSGSGGRALGACSLFVIAAATMLALARVAMLLADTFVSRRSAAVALVRAWRFVSIVQIVFGIVYSLVFLAIALDHEANASFFRRMTLRHIFIADGMVALCTLTLGLLGLWPPLRSKVHDLLSRTGEGVSAAAGIAELLGGGSADELLAHSRTRFRAVRADRLRLEHMALAPHTARRAQRSSPMFRGAILQTATALLSPNRGRAHFGGHVARERRATEGARGRRWPREHRAAEGLPEGWSPREPPTPENARERRLNRARVLSGPAMLRAAPSVWPEASAEACDDHDDAAARRSGKRDDGGAQPSAGLTNAVDEAYALSEPATLGEVDAFLSHRYLAACCALLLPPPCAPSRARGVRAARRQRACMRAPSAADIRAPPPVTPRHARSWHDAAADKFAALQAWRALFKAENGREPLCWCDTRAAHRARARTASWFGARSVRARAVHACSPRHLP